MLKRLIALSVALSVLFLTPTVRPAMSQDRYTLRSGDTIDLSFAYVPEFNQTLTIQPDGYITLRAAGDVRASGLSVPELKKTIESKYSSIMKQPDVSVEIKDFEKP